jgi:hypothetical protein
MKKRLLAVIPVICFFAFLGAVVVYAVSVGPRKIIGVGQRKVMSVSCVPYTVIDYSGGTNGVAPNATTLAAGTHGASGVTSWLVSDPDNALTYSTDAYHALGIDAPLLCTGGQYADTSTVGLNYDTTASVTGIDRVRIYLPSFTGGTVSDAVLATGWFRTSLPQNATVNCDCFTLYSAGGSIPGMSFANGILQGNGTALIGLLEGSTGGAIGAMPSNTWLQWAILYDRSNATNGIRFAVLDASGNQYGTTVIGPATDGFANQLVIGNNKLDTITTGYNIQFGSIMLCYEDCVAADFPFATVAKIKTPTPSSSAGRYYPSISPTLTSEWSDTILYTTDGTIPACPSTGTLYTGAILINTTTTLKSIGCSARAGRISSSVRSDTYEIVPAVSFDVAGAGTTVSNTVISANHTITNGVTNSAVVATLHWVGSTHTASCTHNGNPMTQMWLYRETNANYSYSAAYIIAAGTGDGTAYAVSCTVSGSAVDMGMQTLSFYNVNQTTPYRTPVTQSITGTATSFSVTVANAQDRDMVVDAATLYPVANPDVSTSAQTLRASLRRIRGNTFSGVTSTADATGSTVMGYANMNGSTHYISFGAAALIPVAQ